MIKVLPLSFRAEFILDLHRARRIHIHLNGTVYISAVVHCPVVQHDTTVAKPSNRVHIMRNIQNGSSFGFRDIAHFFQAFLLKRHISHRKNFIHDHDLSIQMRSHRERQLDIHTGGVALHRSIDELTAFGEFDDVLHVGVDLSLCHAENRAIHVDVLTSGELSMKACADLQHGSHTPIQADSAARRSGHTRDNL